GWGALLISGTHRKELFGGELDTTNNKMELTGAIEGLRALKRPSKVRLFTDSQYVKNGIETWIHGWKKNNWKTSAKKAVKNADLWKALDAMCQSHEVEWHWVKGHSNHTENDIADALANKGVEYALNNKG
ncbi:ribonuclease HI, partial [Oleiphilus sp. HI0067]